MSEQLIVSICFLLASNLLMPALILFFAKKDPMIKRYLKICTLFYISGTLLILLLTIFIPQVPLIWVWLCEGLSFGIYAASFAMILYIVKKFAEIAKTSGENMPDGKTIDAKTSDENPSDAKTPEENSRI